MVETSAAPESDDALVLPAFGVLALLKRNLLAKGYELSIEDEDEVVIEALAWHGRHLSVIVIRQDHVDPFKLACWLGGTLIKRLDDPSGEQRGQIIDGLIETLEELLFLETEEVALFSGDDKELMKRMLVAELSGETDHGIGFNGLYLAFHSACGTVKSLNSRNLIRHPKELGKAPSPRSEKIYPA